MPRERKAKFRLDLSAMGQVPRHRWGEESNLGSAGDFGLIQRHIRMAHQLIWRHAIVRHQGNADRCAHFQAFPIDLQRAHDLAQERAGHNGRGIAVGYLAGNDELVTGEASDDTVLADQRGDPRANSVQNLITCLMTFEIVDFLEPVQVDPENTSPTVNICRRDDARQEAVQPKAIGKPGYRVGQGEGFHFRCQRCAAVCRVEGFVQGAKDGGDDRVHCGKEKSDGYRKTCPGDRTMGDGRDDDRCRHQRQLAQSYGRTRGVVRADAYAVAKRIRNDQDLRHRIDVERDGRRGHSAEDEAEAERAELVSEFKLGCTYLFRALRQVTRVDDAQDGDAAEQKDERIEEGATGQIRHDRARDGAVEGAYRERRAPVVERTNE